MVSSVFCADTFNPSPAVISCYCIPSIISAPAHIAGILVADSISRTGLSVPHGLSLQSHKTFFSTEILRMIG